MKTIGLFASLAVLLLIPNATQSQTTSQTSGVLQTQPGSIRGSAGALQRSAHDLLERPRHIAGVYGSRELSRCAAASGRSPSRTVDLLPRL
jgi:hypothetical protein